MEKILLHEINRSLELMGLNHLNNRQSIISESSILKDLIKNVSDFLKPEIQSVNLPVSQGRKKVIKQVKKYVLAGQEVEERFYNAFINLTNDFDANWPAFRTSDNLKKLAQLIRANAGITKEFYDDLISDLVLKTNSVKSETNLYKMLYEVEKRNGISNFNLETELKNFITNEFEFELLSPTFRNNYKSYKDGTFKQTVFPKEINVNSEKLSEKQIKNFNKVISTSTRYWNNFTQLFVKNIEDFKNEIKELSSGFLDELSKMSGRTPEEIKALTNAYSVQISNKLSLIEIKMKGEAINIMETEGIPPDILEILKNDQNMFFKLFRDSIKSAQEGGVDINKITDFMSDSIKNNMNELGTFFKDAFSKRFIQAVKHLVNPKSDLGIWFYTNQWAGLNKLFHLAVKTGALQNKKQAFEWLWKALIATNIGYLTGWATSTGILSIWELIGKPIYNASIGNFLNYGCEMINYLKPLFDCEKVYAQQKDFGDGIRNTVEGAFLQELLGEGIGVMTQKYSSDPVYSAMMRGLPIINYVETWRHSMFAKTIEGVTGRQLAQNYIGGDAKKTTTEIIQTVKDSIPSTDTTSLNELNQAENLLKDTTTNTNSTTDANSGVTKSLLYNYLKDSSGWTIIPEDEENISFIGNNEWTYKGRFNKYTYKFDPTTKKFTQIKKEPIPIN